MTLTAPVPFDADSLASLANPEPFRIVRVKSTDGAWNVVNGSYAAGLHLLSFHRTRATMTITPLDQNPDYPVGEMVTIPSAYLCRA